MKIAVTATGQGIASAVDLRFGRTKYFVSVDTETGRIETIDNTLNMNAVQGAGIQSAKNIIDNGFDCVITGNMGPKAMSLLKTGNVKVYAGAQGTVGDAVQAWKNGELAELDKANVEGHWA